MSFQERRAIVNLVSTILITVIYSAYMAERLPQADAYSPEVYHFWGSFFLILIPVTIVAKIIIYIVFSILNAIATRELEPSITDERDQLIELKSYRNALYVFGIGFLMAMGSPALNMPPSVMFALMLCAGISSEIVADFSQFIFYRRGV